jgi:hypothetical protein
MNYPMWFIEAVHFRRKGLSYTEISHQMSLPRSTIARWLRHAILPTTTTDTLKEKRAEQLAKARSTRSIDKKRLKT